MPGVLPEAGAYCPSDVLHAKLELESGEGFSSLGITGERGMGGGGGRCTVEGQVLHRVNVPGLDGRDAGETASRWSKCPPVGRAWWGHNN